MVRAIDPEAHDAKRQKVPALAVFARAPRAGKAKTRLFPLLKPHRAAAFQAALISDALRKVNALRKHATPYLFLAGGNPAGGRPGSKPSALLRQRGRDLGERLERAFRQLLGCHPSAVVIGTDSPALPLRLLRAALRELRLSDAVLGPCPDGGYYLIGLRRLNAGIFRGVRWGSTFAFRDTLQRLLQRGFICSILKPLSDVDRPRDFKRLRMELARSSAARSMAPCTWRFLKQNSASRADPSSSRASSTK